MRTASAVRRFRPDPVDDAQLRRCLEAATWAPSGSNEQSWRFVVLRGQQHRQLLAGAFRQGFEELRSIYGLQIPEPGDDSRRARMTRSMQHLVDNAAAVPAYVLFCSRPHDGFPEFLEGGSIYPAVQNFLLAVRGEGLGAVQSTWFRYVERELHDLLEIPDGWRIASLVAVGHPVGGHVPVRRKPVAAVSAQDHWNRPFVSD